MRCQKSQKNWWRFLWTASKVNRNQFHNNARLLLSVQNIKSRNYSSPWMALYFWNLIDLILLCLKLGNIDNEKIFLVSKYDFKKIKVGEGVEKMTMAFSDNQRLKKSILDSLPELQKTAFVFSMGNPDFIELIQSKVEELKKRLSMVALSMTLKVNKILRFNIYWYYTREQ